MNKKQLLTNPNCTSSKSFSDKNNGKIKHKIGDKKLWIKKISFINLSYTKNKICGDNYNKNNGYIKNKVDNEKFKTKKKFEIKIFKGFE